MNDDYLNHTHPVIVNLPSKIDDLIDATKDCRDDISSLSKTLDRVLDRFEDYWIDKVQAKIQTPPMLYQEIYDYYIENDPAPDASQLETLFRLYNYDYKQAVLAYEARNQMSASSSVSGSIKSK